MQGPRLANGRDASYSARGRGCGGSRVPVGVHAMTQHEVRHETPADVGSPSGEAQAILDTIDPFAASDGARFEALLATLRDQCPVAHLGGGTHLVTRHDDVLSVLRDVQAFGNSHCARAPGVRVPPEDRLIFAEYDPPEHGPLRQLFIDLLSRGRSEGHTELIRTTATGLLGPLLADGRGELVADLAAPLGGRVMMEIIGLPVDDWHRHLEWMGAMSVSGFMATNRTDAGVGYAACFPEVVDYFDAALAEREALPDPPDDVLTRIVQARLDGAPLSQTHRRMVLLSLIFGGVNTIVHLFGNLLQTLIEQPEVLEALRADRALVPVAVEESLRRDSPVMFLTRVCTRDTEVAGQPVQAGERVMLHLLSANRDERVYAEPERFRLDRDEAAHVALGWGAHWCLGAAIARALATTLVDTVLDRVDTMTFEPGFVPEPYSSGVSHAPAELRARLTAR